MCGDSTEPQPVGVDPLDVDSRHRRVELARDLDGDPHAAASDTNDDRLVKPKRDERLCEDATGGSTIPEERRIQGTRRTCRLWLPRLTTPPSAAASARHRMAGETRPGPSTLGSLRARRDLSAHARARGQRRLGDLRARARPVTWACRPARLPRPAALDRTRRRRPADRGRPRIPRLTLDVRAHRRDVARDRPPRSDPTAPRRPRRRPFPAQRDDPARRAATGRVERARPPARGAAAVLLAGRARLPQARLRLDRAPQQARDHDLPPRGADARRAARRARGEGAPDPPRHRPRPLPARAGGA